MPGAPSLPFAQYGTKHGHAAGWLRVMLASPDVEVVGLYEPDRERRAALQAAGEPPWSDVHWCDDPSEILDDPRVVAVAAEGTNQESLDHADQIVAAGKHLLLDKPAGDDYAHFERLVRQARERRLFIQLGYMFRHHAGFERIAVWARGGFLGRIYAVRAHMSGSAPTGKSPLAHHRGGVFCDLAGHVLDQIVWILGPPARVHGFMQNSEGMIEGDTDNSVTVLEYERALAIVDIARLEVDAKRKRRFEVFGTKGSAILEPYEPADSLRLCLDAPRDGFLAGTSTLELEARPRFVASLAAFVRTLRGEQEPDRDLDHELLVQETLFRATGSLAR